MPDPSPESQTRISVGDVTVAKHDPKFRKLGSYSRWTPRPVGCPQTVLPMVKEIQGRAFSSRERPTAWA